MVVEIVVEGKMVSIVDIEHRIHKKNSIHDSKAMTMVEPKAVRLNSNYFVKTGEIVVA